MASRISNRRFLLLAAAFMLLCTMISSPVMARALAGEGDTDTVVVASSSGADSDAQGDTAVSVTASSTDPVIAEEPAALAAAAVEADKADEMAGDGEEPAAAAADVATPPPDNAIAAATVETDAVVAAGQVCNSTQQICGCVPRPGLGKSPCPSPPVYPAFSSEANGKFTKAADYSSFSCLANVWEDCSVGGPNAWDENNYCKACYLYMRHCYKSQTQTFVTTSAKLTDKTNAHVLVLPSDPCTGVDNWDANNCQGEKVWNYADRDVVQKQGGTTTPSKFIMAINPVKRRTMQQMHVHVGEMWPSMLTALKKGDEALNKTSGSFNIKCSKATDDCKPTNDTSNVISVRISRGNNTPRAPSDARPFFRAYGPTSTPKKDGNSYAIIYQAAAVVRMSSDDFALLTAPWAAECYFKLDKANSTPKDLFTGTTPKCR